MDYVKLIEDNSDDKPFDLAGSINSINKVSNIDKKIETPKEQPIIKTEVHTPLKTFFTGKFFSATALSKEIGISSKELISEIENLKWIVKKNDEWVLTSLGKSKGAEMKKGQYGEYIAYPETIIKELKVDRW